jgi:hypothetical protein
MSIEAEARNKVLELPKDPHPIIPTIDSKREAMCVEETVESLQMVLYSEHLHYHGRIIHSPANSGFILFGKSGYRWNNSDVVLYMVKPIELTVAVECRSSLSSMIAAIL